MNQKIIIIGASSGIGRVLAETYAQQGNRVGITGRRRELLEEIQRTYPGQIYYRCFDVTGSENIPQLRFLVTELGGLDLLIISAGTGEPAEELKWSIDKAIVDTNINGFVEVANYTFNFFVSQGQGQLAVISSVAANRGSSYAPAYAASKAFQSIYAEGLAIKARKLKKPVFITCIEPGFVKTKMAHGGDRMFWMVPVEKAARQIIHAIERKKRKVYISRRWQIVVFLMRWVPFWVYRRFG